MNDASKKEIIELVNMKMDGVTKETVDIPNTIAGKAGEIAEKLVIEEDKKGKKPTKIIKPDEAKDTPKI